LIFVLTFDTFSGERVEGTLKVLMAGPVPRDKVFVAKWIGGMVCLVTPLLASMLLMAIVVLLSGSTTIPAGDWLRMASMAGVCVLYVAVVFSLAMMVSVIARGPGTAMLALLALWAVFVVAVPALSTPLSWLLVDPVSPEQAETLSNRDLWDLFRSPLQEQCVKDELRNRNVEALPHGQERSHQESVAWTVCAGRHNWPVYADTLKGADDVRARGTQRVEGLSRWLSRLSPYGCLQNVCVTLARTGPEREESIRLALHAYHKAQREYYIEQLDRSPDGAVSGAASPVFRVPRSGLGTDLSVVGIDIGILLLSGILFLMIGYAVFLRSEIA
ncbi:MAG: ABC transporter permease subunit, partial [Chitinivibrionales bacterium]|nr:ABC transporter permease subunit [Chitinivibrionales bacterium]